jgi:hypothetical protein
VKRNFIIEGQSARTIRVEAGGIGVRALSFLLVSLFVSSASPGQTANGFVAPCKIESTVFEGWQAKEISNSWLKVVIVPQLGGRVMQVVFDGHSYLFVNPEYKGQYFPPLKEGEKKRWINYGGDKVWPLPEGNEDEHHWPGPLSDVLDDGEYKLQVLSESTSCSVKLDGPPDTRTGLQYSREIMLSTDSPEIKFHTMMKNSSQRQIEWSMQTVTQYDTADAKRANGYNKEFWAFAPVNPKSIYLEKYHVRSGLADDPSFSVRDGWFRLHWLPLMNEVWLDSPDGWIAVVDGSSRYAMVERFTFYPEAEYPGKASVIFYKNGSTMEIDREGRPALTSNQSDAKLKYMEAELNSPMVSLAAGQSYAMDTQWFPTRVGKELSSVANAGITGTVFAARRTASGIWLTGSFGVFFAGTLKAELFDGTKTLLADIEVARVEPKESLTLEKEIAAPTAVDQVILHIVNLRGIDCGELGSANVQPKSGSL